jgi:hypothetical protein
MHSEAGKHPLGDNFSDSSPSDESVFVAHPRIPSQRVRRCKCTNLGTACSDFDPSAEQPVDNLRDGLRECASWLTDRLIFPNPHRRAELSSRIRSSSSKLRRSATWIHGLLFPHRRICELEWLSDALFTEHCSWITSCIMLVGQLIERRPWDFSVKSKALLPLIEIFSLLQEVQRVRLEILWGTQFAEEETDFEASYAPSRTAKQLYAQHPNVKWASGCMEDHSSQVASGVHHCSNDCIERLQASEYISKTKMEVEQCHTCEPDAKYRLVNRVERLQASRAAIEVKIAMRLVLRDRPSVSCCNALLPKTLEED